MNTGFKLLNNEEKEKIALYFFGSIGEVYQIKQWLKVLTELHKVEPLSIIVRNKSVYEDLLEATDIPVNYINTLDELLTFYEESHFKVILYVNNGMKNFQSLIYHRALHIHLNHGESEKSSMHSNQCKAYDYTFVVGDAAIDRYKRHIINIKRAHYIKIGRPQFDHITELEKAFTKTVVLYAPTDESTHISMRYTSLQRLGLTIVDSILANPKFQLIYRPHPSTGKNSPIVKKINEKIIKKVNAATNGYFEEDLDALDLLSIVDISIFDNSSLIIDFLHFNKPMFVTNMFIDEFHDTTSLKMLDSCIMLDEQNIDNLNELLSDELNNDTLKSKRATIKQYYLGEYKKEESTKLFIEKILETMKERDTLLKEKNMLNTIH